MNTSSKKITPEYVERLSKCEIFVFGSNLEGQHMGGAAKTAYEKFGAEWGVGEGHTGRCYAIPTMFGKAEDIQPYAKKFIAYAKSHPKNRFLLTRIGCGVAGFTDIEMAQLFENALYVPNISLPKKWIAVIGAKFSSGKKYSEEEKNIPTVINDETLKNLCQKHLYEIGAGVNSFISNIKIRYVEEDGRFGYKYFGNFFFFGDDFYVWEKDDKYAEDHNQDIVMAVFDDECEGRGYARRVLFAGVMTDFIDCKGNKIYTGDVIKVGNKEGVPIYCYAVGAIIYEEGNGYYCFILDNHLLTLNECVQQQFMMTRVGTVFYQLNTNDFINVNQRTFAFNGWRDTEEDRQRKFLMAKYTPSFYQELWEYETLEILGVDYDWE